MLILGPSLVVLTNCCFAGLATSSKALKAVATVAKALDKVAAVAQVFYTVATVAMTL